MGSSTIPATGGTVQLGTLYEEIFTSSGTWTYPTSSTFNGQVEVLCVGGGGAGGSAVDSTAANASFYVTGGGGGAQVTQRTISVLNGGNQTVVVGAGGQGTTTNDRFFAAAGGYSSFGAYTTANLYPDAGTSFGLASQSATVNAIPEINSTLGMNQIAPVTVDGVVSPNLGTFMTRANLSASGANAIYSQYFPVTASVSHRFGFSYAFYTGNLNAQTVQCRVYYYNAAGTSTGSSVFTTYTIPTASSGTWTAATLTATPPAGSVSARFSWTSTNAITGNHYLCSLFSNLASTAVTTAVYGYSSGYEWLGVPFQSQTVVANDANFVYAAGGGGGWSVCLGTVVTGITAYPGTQGYSSGGFAAHGSTGPSTTLQIGGCGGGALSSAFNNQAFLTSGLVTNITDQNRMWQANIKTSTKFTYALGRAGGDGSQAFTLSTATSGDMTQVRDWGGNGAGVNVLGWGGYGTYGTGGCGGWNSATAYFDIINFVRTGNTACAPTAAYIPRSTSDDPYVDGLNNTGNGGAGIAGQFATNKRGGNGGSGVVIVRWYA